MNERLLAAGLFGAAAALYWGVSGFIFDGASFTVRTGVTGMIAAVLVGAAAAPTLARDARMPRSKIGKVASGSIAGAWVAVGSIFLVALTEALRVNVRLAAASEDGLRSFFGPVEGSGLHALWHLTKDIGSYTFASTMVGVFFDWQAMLFGAAAGIVYYRIVKRRAATGDKQE